MRRVSLLLGIAENDPEARSRVKAFQQGLRDLGWVEGRNIRVDYRFAAGDPDRIRAYARELVELAPDVIVGNGTPGIAALRQATSSIPIVFAVVNDPVGQGFISSLAHPGGNITGFTFIDFEMVGKWLAMLNDAVPNLSRAALMFNPSLAPYFDVYLRSFEATPRSIKAVVTAAPVRDAAEVEAAVAKLAGDPGGSLIAAPDRRRQPRRYPEIGGTASRARDLHVSTVCSGRRPDVVRTGHGRHLSPLSVVCRSNPKGRKTG
jgi:putative ABC transport system substrate-binding protein